MPWPARLLIGTCCALVALGLPLTATAGLVGELGPGTLPLEPMPYILGNHPGGAEAEPYYGLRLDGLDGNPDHVFTFDFGYCNGFAESLGCTSQAVLEGLSNVGVIADFDGTTLAIAGTVYGGRAQGGAFQSPIRWALDFQYSDFDFDAVEQIFFVGEGSGAGSITALEAGGGFEQDDVFALTDKANQQGVSFALAFDHRGFADRISGFGWLRADGVSQDFRDFLFTVEPVPEPNTLLLTGLGLLGLVWRRRALH